ncbi:MAG: nucleotide-binding protein [Phycisphaerales bacterium]|nr:nucleotide-binding protein [Phycisphaerales bacterium]
MIDRFTGPAGRNALIEVLLAQPIVRNCQEIAGSLAAGGELVPFADGQRLMEQGGGDQVLFCLLTGAVDVLVSGQHVATRSKGTVVGEMAAMDPASPRSATVVAKGETVTLRVPRALLLAIGEKHPEVWARMALLACERLRERNRFHLAPNNRPALFVGSSVEGLPAARAIRSGLKYDNYEVHLWEQGGIFGPSRTPIDDLVSESRRADFALLVLGADDRVASRGVDHDAPRDNIVFEIGLFIGALGKERVLLITDDSLDLKLPSDLTGVPPIRYRNPSGGPLEHAVGSAVDDVRRVIERLGVVSTRMEHC